MANLFRFLGGVVAGLVIAFLSAVVVELFSAVVYPFPAGFGGTMEEMHRHVANYPHWVLAVALLGWGLGAFVASWAARRIGARAAAVVVGLLLLVGVVFNISMLPYPTWFEFAGPPAILLAVACGMGLGRQGP